MKKRIRSVGGEGEKYYVQKSHGLFMLFTLIFEVSKMKFKGKKERKKEIVNGV